MEILGLSYCKDISKLTLVLQKLENSITFISIFSSQELCKAFNL